MTRLQHIVIALICALAAVHCGGQNQAAKYAAQTDDDKARAALESGDYDTAIELLEGLIEKDSTKYNRYALLAAAYAERGGLDIFQIVQAQITGGGGGSGGSSIFAQIGDFLPANPTKANLADVKTAVTHLNEIPGAIRATGSGEKVGSSATFQLLLYQAAYSAMYLNQFTVPTASGSLDPSKLATMTDEDVSNILNALAGAAASGNGISPEVAAAITDTISAINSTSGATQHDKLINYLNANPNAAAN